MANVTGDADVVEVDVVEEVVVTEVGLSVSEDRLWPDAVTVPWSARGTEYVRVV